MVALRWARGAVVGTSATGLALLAHAWASGGLPPAAGVAAVLAAVVVLSVVLSTRRWTLAPLVLVLLGAQVVFHVAFGGSAGLQHGQHAAGGPGLAMVAGHGVAVLLTALLLRRGEDLSWRLLALLGRGWSVTRPAEARPVSNAVESPRVTTRVAASPTVVLLRDVAARRGPPATATA